MTLQDFYISQNIILKNGIFVLAIWASINLFFGILGILKTENEYKHFSVMNFCWNIVNMMIVIYSFYSFEIKNNITKLEVLKNQHFLEMIFIVNAVLDLMYITFGFYLQEKSKNAKTLLLCEQNKGFGWGLVLQGSFLLVFDFCMFWIVLKNGNLYNFGL